MPKKPTQERDAQATQQKILAAAEEVFAEKGFDGARVDEIAKRANVNKAMLYYYFQSKEQLLRALTEKHFKEMSQEKLYLIESLSPDEPVLAERMSEHMMGMLVKRRSFLRIIAIEALKNNEFSQDLFRIIESAIPHLNTVVEKAGLDSEMLNRLKTNIFFFGFTPVLLYLTLGEQWIKHTGMDEQSFRQSFMEYFNNSFLHSITEQFKLDLKDSLN
ncbi:TetR/AcrR family transcriptional regulator [Paenibacillus illinoisensis]|uniref:TetR/AcrR family transcriptional regulator n=1 Tax=Paenibacillus illinoisensis TaxID=59845 RepID=UPI001C8D7CE4|nr:TetR/AcrR family transcriptional regulator [Paenibacillus illinoisensis]MBY0217815.1 TetR/AcrR family transcriptional regulator [Paenibacillus illinoisensis]